MNQKQKMLCIGDLVRYYGEAKYKTQETMEKISQNKGASAMLLNAIRRTPGMAGMTIDTLLHQLRTAAEVEIFGFTVNGQNICLPIEKESNLNIEIYMNPMYFSTKAALTTYMPSIGRKKRTVELQEKREKEIWVRWFEKELNNYHPLTECKKNILED
jgi:hypothetical protein